MKSPAEQYTALLRGIGSPPQVTSPSYRYSARSARIGVNRMPASENRPRQYSSAELGGAADVVLELLDPVGSLGPAAAARRVGTRRRPGSSDPPSTKHAPVANTTAASRTASRRERGWIGAHAIGYPAGLPIHAGDAISVDLS